MEKLEKFISTYENHPKAGISFKDVIEIAQHPSIFRKIILEMATSKIIKEAEAIISIDAEFCFWFSNIFKGFKTNDCCKKTWQASRNW